MTFVKIKSMRMKYNLFCALIALLLFLFIPVVFFWVYFLPQKWQAQILKIPVKIWCKCLLIGFGIKLYYYEKISLKTKSLVIFTNHLSSMDASIIMSFFHCGFILKSSLMRNPFGWCQKFFGSVSLKRSSITSFLKARIKCEKRLKQKLTLCLFPEGTRGNGKKLAPFKRGMIDIYYRNLTAYFSIKFHLILHRWHLLNNGILGKHV